MAFWRFATGLLGIAAALLTLGAVFRAMAGAWDASDFPDMLLVKVEALPVIFPVHMATGGFALVLVPAAILVSGTRWHRLVARIAAADVVVAALTAIPVALESPITRWTAAGFTTQAVLWLTLLGLGVRAIRRGDVRGHRRFMLAMAAVTSGAMFFRVFLAGWIALNGYAHFKTFYSCDAFAGWITPLAGMSVWLFWRERGRQPPSSKA